METRANYVAVGAFVLACMLALVVTVLWLAGVQYSQEYVYYQTKFTGSVTGLGKGTTVRYNGIEVGRVESLDFAPNDPSSVIATLQVRPDLSIYKDATASIASQGLTGGSYVEIIGGKLRDDADKLPQILDRRAPLENDLHGTLLDRPLHHVDGGIRRNIGACPLVVAARERLDRLGELTFGKYAHLGDEGGELTKIGIETSGAASKEGHAFRTGLECFFL